MKRTVFILSLIACTLFGFAENRVWVSPLEIKPGEQAYLRVNYEFDKGHTFCNYQMKVNLPDGVTVDGTSVVLGSCHTSHTGSIVNNVLVVTSMNAVLQGTSGVLVEIPVVADNGLTVGTHLEGNLENVRLGQTNETSVNSTGIAFDVDIVDYIILDENSITAPESTTTAKKVKVKRTIKAGEWSTICLPFDMTEEEVKNIFGNDVKLAEFGSYDIEQDGSSITSISINFNEVDLADGFYGNTPYMLYTSNNIDEFTINSATIEAYEVEQSYTNGSGSKKKTGKFIGTYEAETVVPNNSMFLNGNKFYYSAGKTKMKAFRAYFTFNKVLSDASAAAARITMSFGGDEATGMKMIQGVRLMVNGEVYDLQGRKVTEPVKKGVYVRDGRKVVVK